MINISRPKIQKLGFGKRTVSSVAAALAFVVTMSVNPLVVEPAQAEETKVTPESQMQMQLSFAPLVKEAAPAVVNIYTKKVVESRQGASLFNDPFFQKFFGNRFNLGGKKKKVENSLGSGVIVKDNGVVVTNNHVIAGATEIRVVLSDRREFDAKVLLADDRTDLAVLELEKVKEELPALTFGDSDALEVGDLVLAIGNPFGVGQTVTSGIVSGLARTAVSVSDFRSFIQTDAAINPGNSGGALMSMNGEVVGINTAIFSKTGGSVGIGFAIPATMVEAVVDSAITGEPLLRPWLGFNGRDVTSEIADALGMDRPGGVLVEDIFEGSPAKKAGVQPGDVILSVEDYEVEDGQVLRFRLATRGIGGAAKVSLLRGGDVKEVSFDLIAPPETPARDELIVEGHSPLAGLRLYNLSPAVAEELHMPSNAKGVVVSGVIKRSPAARLGVKNRDRILAINGQDTPMVQDVRDALETDGGEWHVVIERNGRKHVIEVR
ncbi:DegQ family serine endoprotease [Curvivirga sp.]|uniref:DegQ family serine endoprotease n=1 Tax=Curvivirga sp. TaxID=2856848 RepID=UPI003B59A79A